MYIEFVPVLFFFWLALTIICLTIGAGMAAEKFPKLRTHLLVGPVTVLVSFLIGTTVWFEFSAWQSRRELRVYIQSGGAQAPSLFFPFRARCYESVRGIPYAMYGTAAATGYNDPDPQVRARCLKASLALFDGEGSDLYGPIVKVLHQAQQDPAPEIQQILVDSGIKKPVGGSQPAGKEN
ncbi:MAG TPA: hypothetical protein PLB18_24815 [Acidobacteriota bacterium]|nr:hypothetical protein [Acidobacteriota bacterium]HNB71591.1 hypothetical protein [Acidobacteriota bacterium]HND22614.1 hypothetical protein [Acidobacteriota bacterium]HNG92236.1 hypothetical protein [Acidobacteriota bacterium]HNH82323.1 hypothetical protein [Acidobacteriota bacterium]